MRTGVIDVGSNSVRLGIFDDDLLISKRLITSRLGEGVSFGKLSDTAIERTVLAIKSLYVVAKEEGAERFFVFATEAVRRAENRQDFLFKVKQQTGLDVYVASAYEEALWAVVGGLLGEDGLVIDLGGASTELAVLLNGELVYNNSVGFGAVVLNDECGAERDKLTAYIANELQKYGKIPEARRIVAIGGTATSLTACALGLKEYDCSKVDGSFVSKNTLVALADELEGKNVDYITGKYCVDARRAEVLFGGALAFIAILDMLSANGFIASESDNLEGFYKTKVGELAK